MSAPDTAIRRPMVQVYQQPNIPQEEIGERAWHALAREIDHSNRYAAAPTAAPYWCWLHDLTIADRFGREAEQQALAREVERRIGMRWAAEALDWVGDITDDHQAVSLVWHRLLTGDLEPAEVTR